MRTIKKAKNEVVIPKYVVGEKLSLSTWQHDGRGQSIRHWQTVTVVQDNKVTVDLLKANGDVVRFDKRGEFGALLVRGHVDGIVDFVEYRR